jgi:hypothetical protein
MVTVVIIMAMEGITTTNKVQRRDINNKGDNNVPITVITIGLHKNEITTTTTITTIRGDKSREVSISI